MPPSRSVSAQRDIELGAVEADAEPLPDLSTGGQTLPQLIQYLPLTGSQDVGVRWTAPHGQDASVFLAELHYPTQIPHGARASGFR